MNKKTATRSALFTSFISLLLCVSMLVGTTFAWFTDSVTSGVNKIIAGNLDVDVYYGDPAQENSISAINTLFNDVTLWEPGAVAWENLTVANLGSLALKYQMSINFTNENTVNGYGLSQVLQVAVVEPIAAGASREDVLKAVADKGVLLTDLTEEGKLLPVGATPATADEIVGSKTYGVVIWWEPSAEDNNWNVQNGKTTSDGAEYLHIDLGVNVVATQLEAESDSFGTDYDEDAAYPAADNVYVPAGTTTATKLGVNDDAIYVDIPAGNPAGDYMLDVANKTVTDEADGTVTVAYDISLYYEGVKVTGVEYPVHIFVGKLLKGVNKVTHNGVEIPGAAASYDPFTGYVSFVTDSFSPFAVNYGELAVGEGYPVTGAAELAKAIAAIEKSGSVALTEDVALTETLVIEAGKTVVLDLAGKELTAPVTAIKNYGTLTIEGDGVIDITEATATSLQVVDNAAGGVLTLNGGTYKGAKTLYSYAVRSAGELTVNEAAVEGGFGGIAVQANTKATINDGTFSNSMDEGAHVVIVWGGAELTVNGGTFNGHQQSNNNYQYTIITIGDGVATINDGEFTAQTQASGTKLMFSGNVVAKGGYFDTDPAKQVADGYEVVTEDGKYKVQSGPVAKIGGNKYYNIDEAIAAWTNGSTLTLQKDVTLNDVIKLKSTEHHILNLGTYTLTAAAKKNAIEITPEGAGRAARSCLTINADTTNPGGITAIGNACIYYKKTNGIDDRLMVTVNGGVFNGSNAISSSSNNGGQACPYYVINGGTFNGGVILTKAMLKVTGGTFNGMFSCTGDSTAYRLISGGTFKNFLFMTADAANKFVIGTAKGVYDVGVYVNKDNYLVVGGPVITEPGDKFETEPKSYSAWSSYLKYSSAATYGLYYEKAE